MTEDKPAPPNAPAPSNGEQSREEKIAAAKARAEALKAQRAAAGGGAAAPAAPSGATPPRAATTPAAAGGFKPLVASKNPGGAPVVAPKEPKMEALGTLTQAVEIRCAAGEEPNIVKILGGLGLYKNPLRGVWQLDYRYYAEAVRRLQSAGYEIDGKDYLGRPLAQWVPEARGWTRVQ
ncbi:MAG TPA: hypothetical protein VEZ44_05170 [bacterium]|nr:hypothetical protein [bacterium]